MIDSTPPTHAMLACLRRLRSTGGRLVERHLFPVGYQIVLPDGRAPYFYPAESGRGLVSRGLVGADGRPTAAGMLALPEDNP